MKKLLYFAIISLCLTACGHNEDEILQWMDKTKQETRPSLTKLSEPKDYVPFTYDEVNKLDPFNSEKMHSAMAKLNPGSANGIKPDLDRRREALEAYPLDGLKMVGTLEKGAIRYALIEADSKGIFQAKLGNYIGQNFGLITKVNEDSIDIKEIYLDSGGDWAERVQKLVLQEAKK